MVLRQQAGTSALKQPPKQEGNKTRPAIGDLRAKTNVKNKL